MLDTDLSGIPDQHSEPVQLVLNRRLLNASLCVLIYLTYETFYHFVAIFNDGGMNAIYDPDIMSAWRGWLIVAAALPAICGPDSSKPSHVFCAIMYFMVYIPILIVVPNHLPTLIAASVIMQVFFGMVVIMYISGHDIAFKLNGKAAPFWVVLTVVSLICLCLIARQAISAGVNITGIEDNYLLREQVEMNSATLYAVNIWSSALGPFWMALLLWKRRYILFVLVSLSFVLLYGLTFQKFTLFTPAWLIGFYLLCCLFKSGKFHVLLIGAAVPIMIAVISQFTPLAYFGAGYIGFRMYGIHGLIFVHYVDFFDKNPFTWFSHVNGISWFVTYPYDKVMPLLIGAEYPGGNQNAHFWAMDAVAGAGINSIALVSAVFATIMVFLNSAARKLPASFVVPALSVVALRFADGPIGTNLLTGGLGLLILLLALMPRSIFETNASGR